MLYKDEPLMQCLVGHIQLWHIALVEADDHLGTIREAAYAQQQIHVSLVSS